MLLRCLRAFIRKCTSGIDHHSLGEVGQRTPCSLGAAACCHHDGAGQIDVFLPGHIDSAQQILCAALVDEVVDFILGLCLPPDPFLRVDLSLLE